MIEQDLGCGVPRPEEAQDVARSPGQRPGGRDPQSQARPQQCRRVKARGGQQHLARARHDPPVGQRYRQRPERLGIGPGRQRDIGSGPPVRRPDQPGQCLDGVGRSDAPNPEKVQRRAKPCTREGSRQHIHATGQRRSDGFVALLPASPGRAGDRAPRPTRLQHRAARAGHAPRQDPGLGQQPGHGVAQVCIRLAVCQPDRDEIQRRGRP